MTFPSFSNGSSRDALVHARQHARVGCACVAGGACTGGCGQARVGALSETASDVVWIVGIGFTMFVFFGSILPALFGAATKTKHSYRELRGHRPTQRAEHTKAPGHTPDDWNDYLEGSRKSRSSVIDAEFEPVNGTIQRW